MIVDVEDKFGALLMDLRLQKKYRLWLKGWYDNMMIEKNTLELKMLDCEWSMWCWNFK